MSGGFWWGERVTEFERCQTGRLFDPVRENLFLLIFCQWFWPNDHFAFFRAYLEKDYGCAE
jgi:hypothetical protein